MSSRPLNLLRKTVGFRLTLWYSGIFILSSLLVFVLAYFLLSSSLARQDHDTIRLKLKSLSTLYRAGGMDLLERQAFMEKKFEKKRPLFIRVSEKDGRTLFLLIPYQWSGFDIRRLEKASPRPGEDWIRIPSTNSKGVLEIASVPLPGDRRLQVGKSTEDRERVLAQFRAIFMGVLVPVVVFGLAAGAFLAFSALRPVRQLIGTIRSIAGGKMDARVPGPNTGDELEELVTLFNTMLTKIETLINGMRSALDNVAHDLRTPMTRLRGIAEAALRSGEGSAACREALATCMEESERILRMLNTLMDISEAETGVMALHREQVNIRELAASILDIYGCVAEDGEIRLSLDIPEDLTLRADPVRIRQALGNLVDNAVKYTPRGGRVAITASREQGEIRITVRDSGIGVPPGDLPRIWERLYRGDQSRAKKGLGLGLSLVKAIVEAHNGRVRVESAPGKGSAFTLVLPAGE
ncbi:MAG: two-component sensor histidine kinase [Deltaproteobacteria bacterium]|nr:MAG: two-component sensor histidine kinase [Deltaproteobacteria bacterium]